MVGTAERRQVPRAVLAQGTVTRTRGAALRRQTALGPCSRRATFLQSAGAFGGQAEASGRAWHGLAPRGMAPRGNAAARTDKPAR